MVMNEIVMIEGDDLESLIDHLEELIKRQRDLRLPNFVRFCVDDGALKFKVGGGIWTRPFGHLEHRP